MGQIKVNIGINDADTLGGININDGMELEVGDLIETGTMNLIPGDTHVLVGYSSGTTDPPYNEKGAYILIKNKATNPTSYIEVATYISSAEHSGAGDYVTTQRLYGRELTWLNAASPNASGTTIPRAIRIKNGANEDIPVDYALFSRLNIGG